MKTSGNLEIRRHIFPLISFGDFTIAWIATICLFTVLACNTPPHEMIDPDNDVHEFSMEKNFVLDEELANARRASGNIKFTFPEENPGAPFYARVGPLLDQFFVKDGWLVIPFFRNPACIAPDFNLMEVFDVPRAFSCELMVHGFGIIEADASQGTFPIIVHTSGTEVPFWFVPWKQFQDIAKDGVVTIVDIEALNPLKGNADKFKELLRPRMENHHVQINASGILEDGRKFAFHVTHVGDQTKSIGLKIW